MAIFSNFVEELMEVFVDDFLIYRKSFDDFLTNLNKVLCRFREVNLVFN